MNPLTRRDFLAASAALALSPRLSAQPQADDLTLWYDKPAAQWVDALPIGNGRLGAMVYGGGEDGSAAKETIQFNEDTLWSGKPVDGNNKEAPQYLASIRKAVLEEQDYQKADRLCQKMQGLFAEAYQPLANLRVEFSHAGAVKNYRRELNLDTACARTTYSVGPVHFERQAWVSAPQQVIAFRATASAPGQLTCSISLDSLLQKSLSSPAAGR
jgi:alpha-L-fucosidase 2